MLAIKVWCLPVLTETELKTLYDAIVKAVECTESLGIKGPHLMLVLFPVDAMAFGLGEDILIEVTGVADQPKVAPQMRKDLAHNLLMAVRKSYPKARVFCQIHQDSPWDVNQSV